MRYPRGTELPPTQDQANRRAIRLETISLVYFVTAIIAVYFALGSSQAMKAAWVEDILSLFPPIAFLVASRFRHREPNSRFPWGYHRSITIAYLVSTIALFTLGSYIAIDSIDQLLRGSHPPIGLVEVFDTQIWSGWLMIAALAYSGIPTVFLGRMKLPLAAVLRDKVLFADAEMNRADWMTAGAAAIGVIGIGFGLWWADSVAALVIAGDILKDGVKYLRESVSDLMDKSPRTYDEKKPSPTVAELSNEVAKTAWVEDAVIRLREHGHLVSGDVFIVPKDDEAIPRRIEELMGRLHQKDWPFHDITITCVRAISDAPEELHVERS